MQINQKLIEIMNKELKDREWSLSKHITWKQIIYELYVYPPLNLEKNSILFVAKSPTALANKIIKYFKTKNK